MIERPVGRLGEVEVSESSTDLAVPSSQPSSRAVYDELKALRRGSGISPQRILQSAPNIRSLRVVADQVEFCRLNPEDVHIAAHQVIECTISSIDNAMHQQLCQAALNYRIRTKGALGCMSVMPQPRSDDEMLDSLAKRRESTSDYFYWSDPKTFDKHSGEALHSLADTLVQLSISPCRSDAAALTADFAAEMAVRNVLGVLAFEYRELALNILTRELAGNYPNLVEAKRVAQARSETLIDDLTILRDALLSPRYRRIVNGMVRESTHPPLFWNGGVVADFLFPRADKRDKTPWPLLGLGGDIIETGAEIPTPQARPLRLTRPELQVILAGSFLAVEAVFDQIEAENAWIVSEPDSPTTRAHPVSHSDETGQFGAAEAESVTADESEIQVGEETEDGWDAE